MRKSALALLAALALATTGSPQTPERGPGYYCGATGFDINLGVANKSFRCGIAKIQRGTGTLTLNGTSTVTVTLNGFDSIVTPEAVPGADGVFFKTSGLWYRFGASEYFLRVSAKASASSITVLAGAAGSANSGTTSEWGYWNVTCYRSASNAGVWNVTLDHLDPRIWGHSDSFTQGDYAVALSSTLRTIAYVPATSAAAQVQWATKPRGLRILISSTTPTIFGLTGPTTAGEAVLVAAFGSGAAGTASIRNMDIQTIIQSTASASYPVACLQQAN